jgi:DUF1680 family protein
MARAYELTGNATDKAVVDTFFDALYSNHSYATGGSNSGECWQAPRDLGNFLDAQTEESCTQYNVLKVARRSFLTSADAGKADFYERGALPGSHAWPLATIGCRANFVQPLTRLGSSIITSDQRSQV